MIIPNSWHDQLSALDVDRASASILGALAGGRDMFEVSIQVTSGEPKH